MTEKYAGLPSQITKYAFRINTFIPKGADLKDPILILAILKYSKWFQEIYKIQGNTWELE